MVSILFRDENFRIIILVLQLHDYSMAMKKTFGKKHRKENSFKVVPQVSISRLNILISWEQLWNSENSW